ncbi:transport and Golgi organization 2 homolog isoform X2 [Mercenaria mercenaria]|uniref:transport and Golgi organization 2 homolog isoform X2 n=1 Tax=Mercenaria mercenaria TaxID=6596 RepID=UPI00234EA51B|nr:transport and Golgi organization 2 homolog isoform X2 [Mercenaria mercenaria]XP_053375036.1 transport and Golgi organization 2 homolog isoform X2 [Mercenaria mercenaria]XP_053375037.1 transport and Golgi organization 2 homolog isoform X2 [Mercenaria mercenaria]
MCLLFVYVNEEPEENGYKLILASNRDEYWPRPTDTAKFRDDSKWMGGADLVPGREGGTWLGISAVGKVAVLLNILAFQKPGAKGRGSLVRDFLIGNELCEDYLDRISPSVSQHNPFHLLLIDLKNDCNIHCLSYCQETQRTKKPPGVGAVDNSKDIDVPWRKREEGEKIFTNIVRERGHKDQQDKLVENIIDLLNDKTQYFPDEKLAEQYKDVGLVTESDLITERSCMFVFSPQEQYGTRTNTVILVDKHGNCDFIERTLHTPVDVENLKWSMIEYQFKLNSDL